MSIKRIVVAKLLALSLLVFLTACSSSDGGSGSSSSGGTGSLTLGVTDAPIDDALKVVVEFTGVTLKGESSNQTEIEFDTPKVIDLLSLQGAANELILQDLTVPADSYQWIRLNVVADGHYSEPDDGDIDGHGVGSYLLQEGGTKIALKLSSSTGLKLVSGFTVNDQGQAQFTIDFDLRKAVHGPFDDSVEEYYKLNPALRLIENKNAGHISGFINPDFFLDSSCLDELEGVAVYLYEAGTAVDEFQSIVSRSPISSALVAYDEFDETYQYAFGFLEAGEYVLAMTCQANIDTLEGYEYIDFIPETEIGGIVVEAGITKRVNIN